MPELERLSKELAAVARKADESLKRLDLNAQNARVNLSDIKNIEHKIAQASKDLAQIAPKDMAQLSDELKNDIKSTLLQVANAAKDDGNEAGDKYLDISIMAQDISFRKRIYEHSHELRRSLSKAGLLSSNLFVGDIIRSKLAPTSPQRDYEFSLGVDKRA